MWRTGSFRVQLQRARRSRMRRYGSVSWQHKPQRNCAQLRRRPCVASIPHGRLPCLPHRPVRNSRTAHRPWTPQTRRNSLGHSALQLAASRYHLQLLAGNLAYTSGPGHRFGDSQPSRSQPVGPTVANAAVSSCIGDTCAPPGRLPSCNAPAAEIVCRESRPRCVVDATGEFSLDT